MGRLNPYGGIITVQAGHDGRVLSLEIALGEQVKAGQTIATISGEKQVQNDLSMAELKATNAAKQAKLSSESNAIAETIAQGDLDFATERLRRYENLDGTSISAQETTARQYAVEKAKLALRNTRLKSEQQELSSAQQIKQTNAEVEAVRERLAALRVTSPTEGIVVEVLAGIGSPSNAPIVRIADVSRMVAICDVFQGDLGKLAVGQTVTVSAKSLDADITGKVSSISRMISSRYKTAAVQIELDDDASAGNFIGMEVQVSIEL